MKRKINIIFPVILSFLLTVLRLSYDENPATSGFDLFTYVNAYSSLTLIVLWYFLWQLWEIKRLDRKWNALGLSGILMVLVVLYSYFFDTEIEFRLIGILFPTALLLTIQYALRSQQRAGFLFLEKEQLQTENYKAQLQALHAKIDPHFLFNSLNTLRSMVRQGHDHSEQFILSLSDFYRQTLLYSEEIKLSVSEELKILEAYLFLMKNRNEEAVFVNIDIDQSLHSHFLPTLALQIVVENCFKHNSMTSSRPLRIDIISRENGYIQVVNNVQPKIGKVESTGNGLDLLIKRYKLLGIDKGVIVDQSDDQFMVQLRLID